MSNSLSLLNELKDLASEAAEQEKSATNSERLERSPTPQAKSRSASSSFSLSDALADVHKLVDEEARAERTLRSKTQELAKAAQEAEELAREKQAEEEMARRLATEDERRQILKEERRLAKLKADYEAAVARGENIEMPLELRPPELTPPPQSIQAPNVEEEQERAQAAVKSNQRP